jgi:hypothetical protein
MSDKGNMLLKTLMNESLYEEEDTPSIFNKKDESSENDENLILTPSDLSLMHHLEDGIEDAIVKSVEAEASTDELSDSVKDDMILTELYSENGFAYEYDVIKALKKAGIAGDIKQPAGADASRPDADIKIDGINYGIEVKLNKGAQMGGGSIRFANGKISIVKSAGDNIDPILIKAVKDKSADIKKMLTFISKQKPAAINRNATKFPVTCTQEAWAKTQQAGLLVKTYVKYNTDFIAEHYAKKNISYIQIGGAGLFYLSSNPANLPIPKLTGDIVIEIRSARSGSRPLSSGIYVVGGGIRAQARLKTKAKSPYTADNPTSILEMLKNMKSKTKRSTKSTK